MANCRFLYNNLITSSDMITVSSLRAGFVSTAKKDGDGSATMVPGGDFSGSDDLKYLIEIDGVGAGYEIGEATFEYSNIDADGTTVIASDVATAVGAISLNNDVTITFTGGTGNDFELADKWYFLADARYGPGKMILLDRDKRYRSSALEEPNTITIDLGSAQQVTALAIFDHNFTDAVTISLKGDADNANWDTPDFGGESVTYNADKIVHYLSSAQTYRYWRLEITDAANSDTYIEIGELFLGAYSEPTENFNTNSQRNIQTLNVRNITPFGIERVRHYNLQKIFNFVWSYVVSDMATFITIFESLFDKDTGVTKPFFFNEDSSSPNNTWLVLMDTLPRTWHAKDYYSTQFSLREVLTSV